MAMLRTPEAILVGLALAAGMLFTAAIIGGTVYLGLGLVGA